MQFFDKLFGKKLSQVKLSTVDYNKYFDKKEIDDTPLDFLSLGELFVPSGEIIVCDPLAGYFHAKSLTKIVKPGWYPVTISVAKTKNSGERYAIAKLEFSKDKATRWELALIEGQDIKELKEEDEFFGFPVDAGLGCFMDAKTKYFYNEFDNEFMKDHPDGNIYDDLFAAEFKKNAKDQNDTRDIGDWLNFHLPNKQDMNVIMFHSGYGDGVYPSYWGVTDGGDICSLIIDFMVL
jgi:hypothetical protein